MEWMNYDEFLKRSENVKVRDIETVRDLYNFNTLVSNYVADYLFTELDYGNSVRQERLSDVLRLLKQSRCVSIEEWAESAFGDALKNSDVGFNPQFLVHAAHAYLCYNIACHFDSICLGNIFGTQVCLVNFNIASKPVMSEEVANRLFLVLNTDFRGSNDLELCCNFSFGEFAQVIPVLKSDFLKVKTKLAKCEIRGLDDNFRKEK